MQPVLRGVLRPAQLEGPEPSLGCTGWCCSQRCERPHTALLGACENLVCAFKLATFQAGGDNLVDTIFEGLQEHRRLEITNELTRFVEVDNRWRR